MLPSKVNVFFLPQPLASTTRVKRKTGAGSDQC